MQALGASDKLSRRANQFLAGYFGGPAEGLRTRSEAPHRASAHAQYGWVWCALLQSEVGGIDLGARVWAHVADQLAGVEARRPSDLHRTAAAYLTVQMDGVGKRRRWYLLLVVAGERAAADDQPASAEVANSSPASASAEEAGSQKQDTAAMEAAEVRAGAEVAQPAVEAGCAQATETDASQVPKKIGRFDRLRKSIPKVPIFLRRRAENFSLRRAAASQKANLATFGS